MMQPYPPHPEFNIYKRISEEGEVEEIRKFLRFLQLTWGVPIPAPFLDEKDYSLEHAYMSHCGVDFTKLQAEKEAIREWWDQIP